MNVKKRRKEVKRQIITCPETFLGLNSNEKEVHMKGRTNQQQQNSRIGNQRRCSHHVRNVAIVVLIGFMINLGNPALLAACQGICPNGLNPIQFNAKYYHMGPTGIHDWMMSLSFTHKPYCLPIGEGFTAAPKFPAKYYGYPTWPADMNIDLDGPGLPFKGKELAFTWAYPASKGITMDWHVVKVQSGASIYRIEFYGGSSTQPYPKLKEGWYPATWNFCYDGPFEAIQLDLSPLNEILIKPYFGFVIGKIEECDSSESCELDFGRAINALDSAIAFLIEPTDDEYADEHVMEQLAQICEILRQAQGELEEAGALLQFSNRVTSFPGDRAYISRRTVKKCGV
jgi:hypothetical protein